jgi:tyrosyl-tRNA synthetase
MKPMLAKDSVQKRLNAETNSMTFTEFTYQILQGYDFYYLNKHYGCTMQVGGADQWGNITAGTDLIHRLNPGSECHGLTIPLVCDANGQKFGKSAGNAIFLNADKTSVYAFYQFFLRTLDADAIRYLRIFTFLDEDRIAELEASLKEHPELREPQRVLAEELTRAVHGEAGLESAKKASAVLFGGSLEGLTATDLEGIAADVPSATLEAVSGQPVMDVVTACGFVKSKSEARRLIQGGGLSINNIKVTDVNAVVADEQLIEGKVVLLRQGKKNYFLLRVQ